MSQSQGKCSITRSADQDGDPATASTTESPSPRRARFSGRCSTGDTTGSIAKSMTAGDAAGGCAARGRTAGVDWYSQIAMPVGKSAKIAKTASDVA
jgi:hypothetical protein